MTFPAPAAPPVTVLGRAALFTGLICLGGVLLGLLLGLPGTLARGGWYTVSAAVARGLPMMIVADLLIVGSQFAGGHVQRIGQLGAGHLVAAATLAALVFGFMLAAPGVAAKLPDETFRPFFLGGSLRVFTMLGAGSVGALLVGIELRRVPSTIHPQTAP